ATGTCRTGLSATIVIAFLRRRDYGYRRDSGTRISWGCRRRRGACRIDQDQILVHSINISSCSTSTRS
ncbi:hypothetical protein TorRG33x02_357530, partial [Trema orientale]